MGAGHRRAAADPNHEAKERGQRARTADRLERAAEILEAILGGADGEAVRGGHGSADGSARGAVASAPNDPRRLRLTYPRADVVKNLATARVQASLPLVKERMLREGAADAEEPRALLTKDERAMLVALRRLRRERPGDGSLGTFKIVFDLYEDFEI
jgi:hypothetical protein